MRSQKPAVERQVRDGPAGTGRDRRGHGRGRRHPDGRVKGGSLALELCQVIDC
ncbi:MAG: hypothetical protein ACM32E_09870 [Gemmatimonadota bacterium]